MRVLGVECGGEVLSFAAEAIGVLRGQLRCLVLNPAHVAVTAILEAVVGADARPEHVTRVQDELVAVDECVYLALDEDLGLFVRWSWGWSIAGGW